MEDSDESGTGIEPTTTRSQGNCENRCTTSGASARNKKKLEHTKRKMFCFSNLKEKIPQHKILLSCFEFLNFEEKRLFSIHKKERKKIPSENFFRMLLIF